MCPLCFGRDPRAALLARRRIVQIVPSIAIELGIRPSPEIGTVRLATVAQDNPRYHGKSSRGLGSYGFPSPCPSPNLMLGFQRRIPAPALPPLRSSARMKGRMFRRTPSSMSGSQPIA